MKAVFHGHEKSGGIYTITNEVNGRVYIGSTKRLKGRYHAHCSNLRKQDHHNHDLQLDFCLYGEDVFTFEVVRVIPDEPTRIEEEYLLIRSYTPDGRYNSSEYPCQTTLGFSHSPETKAKMSATRKGHRPTGPSKHSPETKSKMSASHTKRTPDMVARMTAHLTGRKHTPETKSKMRMSALARKTKP